MTNPANLKSFKPGQSGNPNGRPKGSRNKLSEAFLEALHDDFQQHGVAAIERVRAEKPEQYLKVIASILPRDLNVNVNDWDALSDDELIDRIRKLDAQLRGLFDIAPDEPARSAVH